MSHLNVSILAFFDNFCLIKPVLSGNTVWPQASEFKNSPKWPVFGILMNFCKLSWLRSQCLKITEKSHSILRAKRATFKFWVQILNQKYQKWSIWQVFENATFGRFSNTVYTKSLLCKANIVVCRVALRLLTFTSWLEAWGEEDLFPTTALRPRGFSRFLNSKKVYLYCMSWCLTMLEEVI